MARKLVLICLVAALSWLMVGPVCAGEQQGDASVYGNYPPLLSKDNPYADDLVRAKQALDESIRRFWEVYSRDPWNYWAVCNAYWAYSDAYQRYTWVLWRYWNWERTQFAFSGRVLSRVDMLPYELQNVKNEKPVAQTTALIRPFEQPVPGAVIRLYRNIIYYANQGPGGEVKPVQAQPDQGQVAPTDVKTDPKGGIAMPYPPERAWTATTDDHGKFQFKGLPKGNYRYDVTKDGYSPTHGMIEIGEARQNRDIYLTRMRVFDGTVMTVARDVWPIVKQALTRTGGAQIQADAAGAEEIEKILGADQRIAPHFRKLIPVEGVRVSLASPYRYAIPLSGAPGQVPQGAETTPGSVPQSPTPTSVPAEASSLVDPARCIPYQPLTTVTGGDGAFHFENLRESSYRVTAEKPGFIPFSAALTLNRTYTRRKIVIFPLIPGDPKPVPVPLSAEQTETGSGDLNNPFGR